MCSPLRATFVTFVFAAVCWPDETVTAFSLRAGEKQAKAAPKNATRSSSATVIVKGKDAATPPPPSPGTEGWNIANYPTWQEKHCRSDGSFLCDPDGLMQVEARENVAELLQEMRRNAKVTCGQLSSALSGIDRRSPREFNLGVAIAGRWSQSGTDSATLQQFGMVLMSRWGLMPFYNGVDTGEDRRAPLPNCPNAAMLIILPASRQAYLSSPSCEFICDERGGRKVATAVEIALDEHGLDAAVAIGIHEVQRLIEDAEPLSMMKKAGAGTRQFHRAWEDALWGSEKTWTTLGRVVLGLSLLAALGWLLAFVVHQLGVGAQRAMPKEALLCQL